MVRTRACPLLFFAERRDEVLVGRIAKVDLGRRVGACGRAERYCTVADDLAVFFDALEERGPLHQVGQVEVQVVVLRQGVQVAQVQFEQVARSDAADGRHGFDTIRMFQRFGRGWVGVIDPFSISVEKRVWAR